MVTLEYYETVYLSLITNLLFSDHTSQAGQELQAAEEKWSRSPRSLPGNRLREYDSHLNRTDKQSLSTSWTPSLFPGVSSH